MIKTTYQKPEIRDANDNIIQQGAFGKNTALANSTNDGWIDYVANDLEFLYDLAKDEVVPVPSLPASGQMNKTYLLTTTGVSYRWSGTQWVAVSSSEAVGRAETAATNAQNYANAAQQSADDAQDTADDISEHLAQIDRNTGGVSKNSKRISNVEKLLQGNLYDYDTDDTEAYTKTVPAGAMPYAGLEKLGGKTVVWNQLCRNEKPTSTVNDLTFTNNGDGSWTINGTATAGSNKPFSTFAIVSGHKYYIKACPSGGSGTTYYANLSGLGSIDTGNAAISEINSSANLNLRLVFSTGVTFDNVKIYPQCVDLTLMFGSGNEPSTVEEFKSMFPADYYPYNAGELLSAGVTEVVSCANLLANEVLEQGAITTTGAVSSANNRVRTRNFIQVEPNTQYEATTTSQGINVLGIYYYSDLTTFVSRDVPESKDCIFTTSPKTNYLKITYNKTDNNNLVPSDVSPVLLHKIATYPIPASIQSLEGYGWSAGTAYNYIDYERKVFVQNVGRVDLGTLNWGYSETATYFYVSAPSDSQAVVNLGIEAICSKYNTVHLSVNDFKVTDKAIMVNPSNFSANKTLFVRDTSYTGGTALKTALDGVYLYYELAEPIETDISAYLSDDNLIEVGAGGTLTFQNQHGDDYRIPVPSEETYMINLQEAVSNG